MRKQSVELSFYVYGYTFTFFLPFLPRFDNVRQFSYFLFASQGDGNFLRSGLLVKEETKTLLKKKLCKTENV